MAIEVKKENSVRAVHDEMQKIRQNGVDISLSDYIPKHFNEPGLTPAKWYAQIGVDMSDMTVHKMLTHDPDTKWLFPEIFRDAIRKGLTYAPFYSRITVGEENINSTGVTMPYFNESEAELVDTNEGATITEGTMEWGSKQVTISKKARGLKQTYESLAFCPINLATIYFEDLGIQLGASLDAELIDILINGDQADGSEAATVMGVDTPATLVYSDFVRSWVRMNRINRPVRNIITNEEDAVTLLNMSAFQMPVRALGAPLVSLNLQAALPAEQNVFIHNDVPSSQFILVDVTKCIVQLTAMPLLMESERIVSMQWVGEYASIITGFAIVFSNARVILDYSVDIAAFPGPVVTHG